MQLRTFVQMVVLTMVGFGLRQWAQTVGLLQSNKQPVHISTGTGCIQTSSNQRQQVPGVRGLTAVNSSLQSALD